MNRPTNIHQFIHLFIHYSIPAFKISSHTQDFLRPLCTHISWLNLPLTRPPDPSATQTALQPHQFTILYYHSNHPFISPNHDPPLLFEPPAHLTQPRHWNFPFSSFLGHFSFLRHFLARNPGRNREVEGRKNSRSSVIWSAVSSAP